MQRENVPGLLFCGTEWTANTERAQMSEERARLVCRLQPIGALGQFLPSSRGQRGMVKLSHLSPWPLALMELQTKGAAREDMLQAASQRRGAGDNSPWQPFPW